MVSSGFFSYFAYLFCSVLFSRGADPLGLSPSVTSTIGDPSANRATGADHWGLSSTSLTPAIAHTICRPVLEGHTEPMEAKAPHHQLIADIPGWEIKPF